MQITKLKIENFLSYENSELNLENRGLLLVEGDNRDLGGSNGAGKTTIFEAVCWCLFGATNSGLRGDDVIRHGHKNTRVVVELKVDGKKVIVRRHRKHKQYQNQVHLRINDVDSRGATDRDTQELICQTLQLDWSTFVSVVMFPQGKAGIAAWSDADQKTVLDVLLDLGRFQDARDKLSKILKADQARAAVLSSSLQAATEVLDTADEHLATLKEEHDQFLAAQQTRVEAAEKALEEMRALDPGDGSEITQRLETARQALAEARQEDVLNMVSQIQFKIQELHDTQTMQQARYQALASQAAQWKGQIRDPEEELAKHQDCPSCGQELPAEAREKLYSSFSEQAFEAREREKEARDQMLKISETLARQDSEVGQLQDLLAQTQAKLNDTSGLHSEVVEAEAQLREHQYKVNEWSRDVARHESVVETTKAQESPFLTALEKANERKATALFKRHTVEKELKPLKEDIQYQEFWKNGFGNSGVKSLLMSTVTPMLNERANVYMTDLSNGKATITIKTQKKLKSGELRDKLDFQVEYPNGSASYIGKSGGERRRADLSILLALGDLAASRARAAIQLRLLDEPFESLDALGCEQVVALLQKHLVPRAKTVLVMTHNDSLKALFENCVRVVKENGVSRIEEA